MPSQVPAAYLAAYVVALTIATFLLGSLVLIDTRWVRVLVSAVAVCLVATSGTLYLVHG